MQIRLYQGEVGREGRQEQKGDKRKEFSILRLAKHDVLSLAQSWTFSFHHPSSEPRVSREKLKCIKGSRLKHSLEIVWDIVFWTPYCPEGWTQFGLHPEDRDQDGESSQRHAQGETTKGSDCPPWRRNGCARGGGLHMRKGLDVFSVVPPKRLQIMGRSGTAKMRENFLYLNSSERPYFFLILTSQLQTPEDKDCLVHYNTSQNLE